VSLRYVSLAFSRVYISLTNCSAPSVQLYFFASHVINDTAGFALLLIITYSVKYSKTFSQLAISASDGCWFVCLCVFEKQICFWIVLCFAVLGSSAHTQWREAISMQNLFQAFHTTGTPPKTWPRSHWIPSSCLHTLRPTFHKCKQLAYASPTSYVSSGAFEWTTDEGATDDAIAWRLRYEQFSMKILNGPNYSLFRFPQSI
jgi:hypothetical protein